MHHIIFIYYHFNNQLFKWAEEEQLQSKVHLESQEHFGAVPRPKVRNRKWKRGKKHGYRMLTTDAAIVFHLVWNVLFSIVGWFHCALQVSNFGDGNAGRQEFIPVSKEKLNLLVLSFTANAL